ncbi:MAG: tetratricopeptide repeat protein [Gemmatimonadales bacterium]
MTSSSRAVFIAALLASPVMSITAQRGGQPAAAAAAPPPNPCTVETMQPGPLGIAYFQRQKLVGAKTPDDAMKAIKDAMKAIFDDKNKSNPVGRDYVLAQFLVLGGEYGTVQTRGNLGMPGDKNANVDLVVAIDSLLTIVEKAVPGCANETGQWRELKPYQALVQGAYAAIKAQNPDSAEKLVKRAQILSKAGAQTYDVLWQIARARNDEAGQVANLQIAADKLIGDTLNAGVRANFLFTLGRLQQDFADKKPDKAAKAQQEREAAKSFMAVVREFPGAEETPFALQGISIAMTQSSDTSIAIAAVELVKGNIAKYNDVTLAQTGVVATRAGKTPDAVLLFDAASKANPYSRDYAYNLAAMLYEAKRSSEMLPVVKRLVALDPSNGDNILLFAFAFKGLSDAETNAATKKALIDSVNYYGKVADDMAQVHKLVYTEFDRLKDKTILAGQVENHGKAARTFTIDFEFLGKDGSVIGKQTATVKDVKPNGVGDFSVELPMGGAMGVRYAALPMK